MVSRIVIALIKFYQKALSPLKMPSCRFYPSCSEYFKEAVVKRGLVRGSLLGIWRIVRCNPFCRGGYDPVPWIDDADPDPGIEDADPTPGIEDETTGEAES